jgi:hypothetical protein
VDDEMTNLDQAYEYCRGLHRRLDAALDSVERVRETVATLEPLAKKFPETRFCKALVLPVIDQWTNEYLQDRFGASAAAVCAALRCEGYRDLIKYYQKSGRQTYYSDTPKTRANQPIGKNGKRPGGQACPDWAIRFASPQGSLRVVGEAKFASGTRSKELLQADLRHDLIYYLNIESDIESDSETDWGHDFGYGVAYSAGGHGPRNGTLVEDNWPHDRILMSVFTEKL